MGLHEGLLEAEGDLLPGRPWAGPVVYLPEVETLGTPGGMSTRQQNRPQSRQQTTGLRIWTSRVTRSI